MAGEKKARRFRRNIAIAAVVTVLFFGALELVFVFLDLRNRQTPLHIVREDRPYIYQLNPQHPEISSQGLRDKEYTIPKRDGVSRILILGDSVTYGWFVAPANTFAKRLEADLNERQGRIEVINAGVHGYTAYNELHYYLSEGRAFGAEIVVVAFCMNDIADPLLHWQWSKQVIKEMPQGAIPNPQYHREHIVPQFKRRQRIALLCKSALFRFARLQVLKIRARGKDPVRSWQYLAGESLPTRLTGEDTISIKVLMDYESPEWRWLRSVYDQLADAVASDGAKLLIMAVPLGYQLDESYPYLPQQLLRRYCEEKGIAYLDLLPSFREHKERNPFNQPDIWHLTAGGHELVADELGRYLDAHGLLRPADSAEGAER